jgi:hypothetical protein
LTKLIPNKASMMMINWIFQYYIPNELKNVFSSIISMSLRLFRWDFLHRRISFTRCFVLKIDATFWNFRFILLSFPLRSEYGRLCQWCLITKLDLTVI